MPRNVNPGTIQIGKGRVPSGTVEDNSLRNPNRDVQPLRAHIDDPSRAHWAEAIAVEDTAGNFVSDEVEGALAELAGGGGAGRMNGLVSGGGFSSAGLNITLDTPTTCLLNGSLFVASGLTLAIPDSSTIFLYLDVSTGTLAQSGAAPTFASENILLHEITTAGGVVTNSRDGRWFVFHLDRKPPLTVRSDGSEVNKAAEANFVTLEAALLWLELYAATGASSMDTHRIIVRGAHVIGATIDSLTENTIFEGDGDASFITGATLAPMFDLQALPGIQFKNIRFICNHTGSTAIRNGSGGSAGENIQLTNVDFDTGSQAWVRALDLTTGVKVRCERVRATVSDAAFRIDDANECVFYDCTAEATGTPTAGFYLWDTTLPTTGEGRNTIRDCLVTGVFTDGMNLRGVDTTVSNCQITGTLNGIRLRDLSSSAGDDHRPVIEDCRITLDTTGGISGILVTGEAEFCKIANCTIRNPRTAWNGSDDPFGIAITGGSTHNTLSDCSILGFYNDNGDLGVGIRIGAGCSSSKVLGCSVSLSKTGILINAADQVTVSGCDVDQVEAGLTTGGVTTVISDGLFSLDSSRGLVGIVSTALGTQISNSKVNNPRTVYAGGEAIFGISLQGANAKVVNSEVVGFYNSTDDTGHCIYVSGTASEALIDNCLLRTAKRGVETTEFNTTIRGCRIESTETGVLSSAMSTTVSDCGIVPDSTRGLIAVDLVTGADAAMIANCFLDFPRTFAPAEAGEPNGVRVGADNVTVQGCVINGFRNNDSDVGHGVVVLATRHGSAVLGNNLDSNLVGILVSSGCTAWRVNDNRINGEGLAATQGIAVIGVDGANTRTRNFVITGNTIIGIAALGIHLQAYVRDGTISDNNVDGFLGGDPFNPTCTAGIYLQGNGTNSAPRFITITGNSIQRCANGMLLEGVNTTSRIRDCVVSSNTVHHCAFAEAAFADDFAAGCKGIALDWARDTTVIGNTILRIGQVVDNTGTQQPPTTGGVNVQPYGIQLRNCEGVQATNNTVEESRALGTGASAGILVENKSTGSTITFTGVAVTDNTLRNNENRGIAVFLADGSVALTDITLEALVVDGNTIHQHDDSGVYIQLQGVVKLNNTKVDGNSIQSIANTSEGYIFLEAVATADPELRGLSVSGNNIYDPDGVGVDGIVLEMGILQVQEGVSLLNNNIKFDGTSGATGIAVNEDNSSTIFLNGLNISGNTLTSVGLTGINIIHDHIDACTINSNNFFLQESQGITFSGSVYTNVTVDGNTYKGDGLNSLGLLLMSINDGGSEIPSTGITITNNNIANYTGEGIDFQLGEPVLDVEISGNVITQRDYVTSLTAGILTGIGIQISADTTGGSGVPHLRNWRIHDNVFSQLLAFGIFLDNENSTGFTVENIAIENNSFVQVTRGTVHILDNGALSPGDTVTVNGVIKIADTDFAIAGSAAATATNLVATLQASFPDAFIWSNGSDSAKLMGESWSIQTSVSAAVIDVATNSEAPLHVVCSSPVTNLSICRNSFSKCGSTGNIGGNISVFFYGDGEDYKNIRIDGNTIDGAPEGGIKIECSDGVNNSGALDTWSISNNMMEYEVSFNTSTDAHGIQLDWDDVETVKFVRMSGNTVVGEGFDDGVVLSGATTQGSGEVFSEVRMCDNQVRNVRGDGVRLRYPSRPDNVASRQLRADRNDVYAAGGKGVTISGSSPPLDLPSNGNTFDLFQVSMCHNTIRECGNHGLRLQHNVGNTGTSELHDVIISNNMLKLNGTNTTGSPPTSYNGGEHQISCYLTGDTENFILAHNVMHGGSTTGYGFYIGIGDGSAETSAGESIADSNTGSLTAPLYSHNIARNNGNAVAASMVDVGANGTNYPPADGSNLGNIDQSTSGGGNNKWSDIDAGGWTIANLNTI